MVPFDQFAGAVVKGEVLPVGLDQACPQGGRKTVQKFRDAFTDLGAVADVERRITELTGRAVDAVDASSATPAAKQRLRAMADSATARTS